MAPQRKSILNLKRTPERTVYVCDWLIVATCQCLEGYTGADCSLLESAMPATNMAPATLCDYRNENCSFVTVFGRNLLERHSLQCQVREVQVCGKSSLVAAKGS